MKNNKNFSVLGLLGKIFLIVGLLCVALSLTSYFVCKNTISSYVKTQATITDFSVNNYDSNNSTAKTITVIEYMANQKNIKTTISEYSSAWKVGQKLTIYYNPQQPQKATTGMFGVIFSLVFGIIGAVFFVVALIMLCIIKKAEQQKNRLLSLGYAVYATVAGVGTNTRVSFNLRHPSKLECHYSSPDNKTYVFFSEDIWANINSSLIGNTVKVYVDNNNYDNYYVDIKSLNL